MNQHPPERNRCPYCGAFLTAAPTMTIICLPGHAYDWPEQGPPVITPIPPLPPVAIWRCARCQRTIQETRS